MKRLISVAACLACISCMAELPEPGPRLVSSEHEPELFEPIDDPMLGYLRGMVAALPAEEAGEAAGAAGSTGWALGPDLTNGGKLPVHANGSLKAPPGSTLPDLPLGRAQGYMIGPGDEIDLIVGGRAEFSGRLTVRADGTVVLPTSGDLVPVSKMVAEDAAEAIAAAVFPRYLRQRPDVSVQVAASPRFVYYVFGAVEREGRFKLEPGKVKLLDAVLAAGGAEDPGISAELDRRKGARWDSVHVVTPRDDGLESMVVNVEAVMRGDLRRNIVVGPGQVIYVPGRDDATEADEAMLRRLLGRR